MFLGGLNCLYIPKVADLSPIHFRKQTNKAKDGTKPDLNIGETRVLLWFRAKSTTLKMGPYFLLVGAHFVENDEQLWWNVVKKMMMVTKMYGDI